MGSWKSKSLALRLLAKPPEDDANIGSFHVNTSKLFLHHKFWVILYVSTDFSIKMQNYKMVFEHSTFAGPYVFVVPQTSSINRSIYYTSKEMYFLVLCTFVVITKVEEAASAPLCGRQQVGLAP